MRCETCGSTLADNPGGRDTHYRRCSNATAEERADFVRSGRWSRDRKGGPMTKVRLALLRRMADLLRDDVHAPGFNETVASALGMPADKEIPAGTLSAAADYVRTLAETMDNRASRMAKKGGG